MITVLLIILLGEIGVLNPGCLSESQDKILQFIIFIELMIDIAFVSWKGGRK